MNEITEKVDLISDSCHKVTLEPWLDSLGAANFLGISKATLMNLISNDSSFPCFKFGRRNRYLASELDAYIRKNPRGER